MIFLINFESSPEVIVYDSLEDLSSRVEWQDIFEGKDIILDENGIQYKWDASKKEEVGTVYNYTLIVSGTNNELAQKCMRSYESLKHPVEFSIDP